MFEHFTELARRSIVVAQEEARGMGHAHLGPEHLLLGCFAGPSSAAGRALASMGLDLTSARAAVQGRVARSTEPTGHIPFSTDAKQAIEAAYNEGIVLGPGHISTGHLLLGVLNQNDRVVNEVLTELGVTEMALADATRAQLADGDDDDKENPNGR